MEAERGRRWRWRPLSRRERLLTGLWVVISVVLWNGLYDITLAQAVKEYMFRSALHDAGRGPHIPIAAVLDPGIERSLWVSTLWASVVLLAGMLTIRLQRST